MANKQKIPKCRKRPEAVIRRALEVYPFEQAPLFSFVADGWICTQCEKVANG